MKSQKVTFADSVCQHGDADKMSRTGKSLDEVSRKFVMTHRSTSLIQRPATVEEVANLVVYIASPLASATSGASLRVDGGIVDDII